MEISWSWLHQRLGLRGRHSFILSLTSLILSDPMSCLLSWSKWWTATLFLGLRETEPKELEPENGVDCAPESDPESGLKTESCV